MSRDADARTEQDRLRQEYKIRIVVVARPISIIDQNKSMNNVFGFASFPHFVLGLFVIFSRTTLGGIITRPSTIAVK